MVLEHGLIEHAERSISELNPVCHDSTAALTVTCSFCVQSAILSALIRSPIQPRDDDNSSSNSNEDEDEDRQAPVPAATTSRASESATAIAETTSHDCCELRLVAPRAGFVCYACVSYGWGCPVCRADITMVMRIFIVRRKVDQRELANLVCRTYRNN